MAFTYAPEATKDEVDYLENVLLSVVVAGVSIIVVIVVISSVVAGVSTKAVVVIAIVVVIAKEASLCFRFRFSLRLGHSSGKGHYCHKGEESKALAGEHDCCSS